MAVNRRKKVSMKKPEYLYATTVGELRKKYHDNKKSLSNILLLTQTGVLPEIKNIAGESIINSMLTELIIQQEYIRERERANFGWNKEDVDFSTSGCIL